MQTILVIGASGLVGGHLARALQAGGRAVRTLARDPARLSGLAEAGAVIVQGDIADPAAVALAMDGAEAVVISIHTLSPQAAGGAARFMDVEARGIGNVIAAARAAGVRRVVYVTSTGTAPDAPSEWLRERWRTEAMLLDSGLDATVIQPGMIVGRGGQGFDTVVSQARRRLAVTLGGDRPLMRSIAVDDLAHYLADVLPEVRSHGLRLAVGNDDVLSMNGMIDVVADLLGRSAPRKVQMPRRLLRGLAPLVERLVKLPKGAFAGLVDSLDTDVVGDPMPIRVLLPRRLLSFREAAERALAAT